MKKTIALLLCMLTLFSLASCGGDSSGETNGDTGGKSSGTVQTEPEEKETESGTDSLSSDGLVED